MTRLRMRVSARLAIVLVASALAAHASLSALQPPMTTSAKGTFDVKIAPQSPDAYTDATEMGRMTIDKVYHGDLDGTAKGQMLTGMSADTKGPGVYVAMERFVGKLSGKSGSLMLHHTGVMDRGTQSLAITIVPDSGTGQLKGISGTMTIDIAKDGTHSYVLKYTLSP